MKYFIIKIPRGEHYFTQIEGPLIHIISCNVKENGDLDERLLYSNSFGIKSTKNVQFYPNHIIDWSLDEPYTKLLTDKELKNILTPSMISVLQSFGSTVW